MFTIAACGPGVVPNPNPRKKRGRPVRRPLGDRYPHALQHESHQEGVVASMAGQGSAIEVAAVGRAGDDGVAPAIHRHGNAPIVARAAKLHAGHVGAGGGAILGHETIARAHARDNEITPAEVALLPELPGHNYVYTRSE